MEYTNINYDVRSRILSALLRILDEETISDKLLESIQGDIQLLDVDISHEDIQAILNYRTGMTISSQKAFIASIKRVARELKKSRGRCWLTDVQVKEIQSLYKEDIWHSK